MDALDIIKKNAERLLSGIPTHVTLLAAAKTRTAEEVTAAYDGGIRFFGHNYVQEAQTMLAGISFNVQWHMIGHLQRNKAKDAIEIFNMIEVLDSIRLANELEKRCAAAEKTIKV
ncbi:MAG TPA: alanine racemase, partial [Pelolinea sp.]|nr:alanine racemase [Pelolinea sp.]